MQPYHPTQSVTFTYQSIEPTIKHFTNQYSPITRSQIIDDLCFRTLLIISEGESYYFIHKSFQDYFAARHIFSNLKSKEKDDIVIKNIEKVLEILIPFDIGIFLKHFLEEKDTFISDKTLVANNLIKVYHYFIGNDFHSVIIRQQSSHYLTLLKSNDAVQFLIQAYQAEPNKVVQRGIMVGLSLYHNRSDVLEQYINLIRTDPEVASINIGYHLVYYGDQMQELGFYDQSEDRCDKTVKALFRHLKDERYRNGWSLDLLTLSTLLETRGDTVLSSKSWEPAFINELLSRDHRITDIIFNQELMRLKQILKGAKAK